MIRDKEKIYRSKGIDIAKYRQLYDQNKLEKGYFSPFDFYNRLNKYWMG
ncbi:MAG: hypothetical protein QXZ43_03650 [Candidatus Aenigmatarchaeota archaeon]